MNNADATIFYYKNHYFPRSLLIIITLSYLCFGSSERYILRHPEVASRILFGVDDAVVEEDEVPVDDRVAADFANVALFDQHPIRFDKVVLAEAGLELEQLAEIVLNWRENFVFEYWDLRHLMSTFLQVGGGNVFQRFFF